MSEIRKLEPTIVWEIFDDITKVPRPSKKEEKIIAFLKEFAVKHGLEHKSDKIGNVLMTRPATPGMEDKPTVVLQSHMDMVCEKNADVEFDFDNDPIDTYIEDGWVKARGTTLGGDDGIGMAASMAVLIADDIVTPKIEALFTVDEETGLTGAFELGKDMITGKYLINLDSEDDGEIFIGCAGGVDSIATFTYKPEKRPEKHAFFRIGVSGLKGGHSGDDIEKGRGNSNKIVARLLWLADRELDMRLADFNGGNLRNAIPREAHATFAVPVKKTTQLFQLFEKYKSEIEVELNITEPDFDISISEVEPAESVIDLKTQRALLNALVAVPHGVIAMSFSMENLVETSTNLASVKFEEGDKIVVISSQHSSIESSKEYIAAAVRSVFELAGAKVEHSDGYPGWNPNPKSDLLKVSKEQYEKLFDQKPLVRAIHAGLECGLFLEKYPHLEMVSIGPTIRGAHSPDERMEIETVDKFWKHLKAILANI